MTPVHHRCYCVFVRKEGKERHPASKAVIALREALGLSQAEFGAKILGLSEISVARYETSHPPSGEQLRRLRDVAAAQANLYRQKIDRGESGSKKTETHKERMATYKRFRVFRNIAGIFGALFMEELVAQSPERFIPVYATMDEAEHGFLITRVDGGEGIMAAECFLLLLEALASSEKDRRRDALRFLSQMEETTFLLAGMKVHKKVFESMQERYSKLEELDIEENT